MQRLSGLLLMLAGAALGGYTYLPPPQDGAEKLAEVTRISAAPDRDIRASGGAGGYSGDRVDRTFSPSTPLSAPASSGPASSGQPGAQTGATVAAAVMPANSGASNSGAANPVATKPAAPWTAIVTAEPSNSGKLTSSRPGDAETRAVLARDLQLELQRVGCYGGEVNGTWTPSTKRAMTEFMDRVNATLPIEEPDYILLTLVQGHKSAACGADCPSGQVLSNDGRCMPQAVVAQATRKSQREEDRRVAAAQKAQSQAQQQQRVAEDQHTAFEQKREQQRLAEVQRAAETKRIADARSAAKQKAQRLAQAMAAATPEELPWLKDDQTQTRTMTTASTTAALSPRPAPLPGRMAMGGPLSAEPQLPVSIAAVTPDRGPRPEATDINIDADIAAPHDAPVVIAPAPQLAARPYATLPTTVQGLPGTKSGPLVQSQAGFSPKKFRSAKIARRPASLPRYVIYKAPKPKVYYYASNGGGKAHRGRPRPGSIPYLQQQSMGGVY